MPTSQAVISDPFEASPLPDGRWRALVEPWTHECPDPEHWLRTTGLENARHEVEEALRSRPDPILVSGPTGHGKTLLLRSLRINAPRELIPLFVPFSNVEPDDLARWIVGPTLETIGDPAVELMNMLRANVRSGRKTLLLMDEVQSTPPETLAKLFELLAESGGAVSVVLAGLPGEELDLVLEAAPRSIQKIVLAEPWSRVDAELLLTHVALTLNIPAAALIAAIDVDAALRASAGNPRLVRAALGQQLRFAQSVRASVSLGAVSAPLPPSAPLVRISEPPDPPMPIRVIDQTPSETALAIEPHAASAVSPPQRRSRPEKALRRPLPGMKRLERASHGVRVAMVGGACAIRRNCHPLDDAARAHIRDGSVRIRLRWRHCSTFLSTFLRNEGVQAAIDSRRLLSRLRSHSIAHRAVFWDGVRGRAADLQSSIGVAGRILSGRTREIRMRFHRLLRPWERIPGFRLQCGLVMAGLFVALGASVAMGRIPLPAMMALSPRSGAVEVEPILFRVNSHPWAIVEVDGVKAGSTPLTISLAPGSHRFRIEMADGQIHEDVLVVSTRLDHHAFRSPFAPGPETPRAHFASAPP